jgi:hypothetical protein
MTYVARDTVKQHSIEEYLICFLCFKLFMVIVLGTYPYNHCIWCSSFTEEFTSVFFILTIWCNNEILSLYILNCRIFTYFNTFKPVLYGQ